MGNESVQDKINAVLVSGDDLLRAADVVHKLPKGDRGFNERLRATTSLFGSQLKALAVDDRMNALTDLIREGALPGWALPSNDAGDMTVAEPVFDAAASEPIIIDDWGPRFDKEAFLLRLMTLVEPEGRA